MSTWGKLNLEGSKNVKGVNVKMEVESNVVVSEKLELGLQTRFSY